MLAVNKYAIESELFLKSLAIVGLCFSAITLLIHLLNVQAILTKSYYIILEFFGCLVLASLFGISITLSIQQSVIKLSAVAVVGLSAGEEKDLCLCVVFFCRFSVVFLWLLMRMMRLQDVLLYAVHRLSQWLYERCKI
jgi:hypothetical protein